jgi:hypothetical protein
MWESKMDNLKTCPLCGSTENLMVYKEWFPVKKPDGKELGVVACTTPHCPMIIRMPTIEEAVQKWNKRPKEDSLNEQLSLMKIELTNAITALEFYTKNEVQK